MKKILLNNPGLKILSFVLAVVLWLVVANIEDPVTTKQYKDVPVTIANEKALNSINKVYEVVSGETASFTVKGRRSVLESLSADDFDVIADLSHLSEVNAVQVDITPKDGDKDIEIYRNMNTLTVSLEDEKEASFSVTVSTQGEPARGYALGEYEVTPNIIDVSGPKSLINRIETVSVDLDVDNARADFKQDCTLHYYTSSGEELDNTRIKCDTQEVTVSIQILKTKDITVSVNTIGQPAEGYSVESLNFEPQTVTIAGTDEVLESINQITIDDVDISGLTKDQEYSFKVSSYVPEDVVLTDPEQKIMVKVQIGQLTTRTLTLTAGQIDIDGGSSDYDYEINKDTAIQVSIYGFSDVISKITAKDLKPMIDVDGLAPGTHTCTLSISSEEDVDITVSAKVKVKISKAK